LSLSNYYEVATASGLKDNTFGFADLGFVADVPLNVRPGPLRQVTLSGGPTCSGWLERPTARRPPDPNALNARTSRAEAGPGVWDGGLKIEY